MKQVTRVELKRVALGDFIQGDELLRDSGLLLGIPPKTLAPLIAAGVARRFSEGSFLFQQGMKGESLYLVLAGEARLRAQREGSQVDLASLGKGDTLGECALVGSPPMRALSAVATGALDVAEFPAPAIRAAMQGWPPLTRYLESLQKARASAQDEMSDFLNRW